MLGFDQALLSSTKNVDEPAQVLIKDDEDESLLTASLVAVYVMGDGLCT
jgi:hypothetical protein